MTSPTWVVDVEIREAKRYHLDQRSLLHCHEWVPPSEGRGGRWEAFWKPGLFPARESAAEIWLYLLCDPGRGLCLAVFKRDTTSRNTSKSQTDLLDCTKNFPSATSWWVLVSTIGRIKVMIKKNVHFLCPSERRVRNLQLQEINKTLKKPELDSVPNDSHNI